MWRARSGVCWLNSQPQSENNDWLTQALYRDNGMMEKGLKRKEVFVWAFYDFANSVYPAVITASVFSVYYTGYVVGNGTSLGDLWWGRALSLSMLFVALTSPFMGYAADRTGTRKRMLLAYTAICVLSVAAFTGLEKGMVLRGFFLVVAANIGFEGALVFYNSYLPGIAPPDKRGLVSGIGFGAGYAGSAAGLMMVLPMVSRGMFDLTWLSVALFFALFSIPAFVFLPADVRTESGFVSSALEGIRGFRRLLGDVFKVRPLRRFLLAYFIYIDGVNTTIYFAAVYAATTLGFSNGELIYLFFIVQLSALLGAFALARATDTRGPKRVLTLVLLLWTGVSIMAFFAESKTAFFLTAVVAGLGLGAVQSASRALMSLLMPSGKESEMFGFYAFCGKSSSVAGPLVFGFVAHSLGGNQRAAVLSVGAFFIIGLLLLQRVSIEHL